MNISTMSANNTMNVSHGSFNVSMFDMYEDRSPFRYLGIQILFGILYGLVFLGCICGNALVMFVIIRHQRMRNITNFFLANLAASDICVGVFCVIPNLMTYFTPYWYAGKVMCKLYFFIQCVSYTTSIIILTVISMERYFAIIHPMLSKRLSRMSLMRVIIIVVWLVAVAYGIPALIVYDTVEIPEDGSSVAFCVNPTGMNLQFMVLINFILLYCIPLLLMSAMYVKISIVLWHSSFETAGTGANGHHARKTEPRKMPRSSPDKSEDSEGDQTTTTRQKLVSGGFERSCTAVARQSTKPKQTALTARRKVIRLLIAIVGSFAACMLPHHVRLLYEMMIPRTHHPTFLYQLVPPLSFLCFYLNSALNPILYAFLSDNFRKRLFEVFKRKPRGWTGGNNGSSVALTKLPGSQHSA